MIKKIILDPTYRKDNGLWNLDTLSLPFPENFHIKERNVVYIPAGEFGGNHKHPRAEAFVGFGQQLFIVWQDNEGKTHEDKMMDDEQLYLFYIEPFTPHAVINKDSGFAILSEFADGPNINVESSEVLNTKWYSSKLSVPYITLGSCHLKMPCLDITRAPSALRCDIGCWVGTAPS